MKIFAPFDEETINKLNIWQNRIDVHPLTCGNENCRAVLVATTKRWICPACNYTQNWAHDFMLDFQFGDLKQLLNMIKERED